MTATDELRGLLDKRGVEHYDGTETTLWDYEPTSESTGSYRIAADETSGGRMQVRMFNVTPEQAIEATLGREPWVSPTWERWHKSLRHDEIKSIGDAVEQLMYEAIEFGGDMGPNGNTYNGIDEGDVLTADFINEWVARFEATLGRGTCHDEGDPGDFCCSECGVRMFTDTSDTYTMIASDGRTIIKHPNYCPNCGRKVRA